LISSKQALSLKRLDILKIHREVFHRQRVQTLPMEKVFLAFTAGASQSLFPGRGNRKNNFYLIAADAAALDPALCLRSCANIGF
jgi:hypothetical protein